MTGDGEPSRKIRQCCRKRNFGALAAQPLEKLVPGEHIGVAGASPRKN